MATPSDERAAARKRVVDWLEAKAPKDRCPICGTQRWLVGDLTHLPVGTEHAPEKVYFVFPVVCSNCGYFRLFHADTMGVAPPDVPSSEEGTG